MSNTDANILLTECISDSMDFYLDRLPGKQEPPISKDEFVGMILLATNSFNHFSFYKFNLSTRNKYTLKTIPSILKIMYKKLFGNKYEKHRNYSWKEKMIYSYVLTFKIPKGMVYFAKEYNGKRTSILEFLSFRLGGIWTAKFGEPGDKNLLWVQALAIGDKFILDKLDYKKNIQDYFREDHPFREAARS